MLQNNSHLGPKTHDASNITSNHCNDDVCRRIMSATPIYMLSSRSTTLFRSPSCLHVHTLSLLLPLQLFWDYALETTLRVPELLGKFPTLDLLHPIPHILLRVWRKITLPEPAENQLFLIPEYPDCTTVTDIIVLTDVSVPNMFLSSLVLHSTVVIAWAPKLYLMM